MRQVYNKCLVLVLVLNFVNDTTVLIKMYVCMNSLAVQGLLKTTTVQARLIFLKTSLFDVKYMRFSALLRNKFFLMSSYTDLTS